ncbi:MAG: patatin-like phospholipase family protein [Burkholderiales bacterium]
MADFALFTESGRVRAAVDSARTACANKFVSDLVDAAGNQYVDFVMEGGGVLGIALTGYTYVLEQAGIRFLGVGGTSAGSINALMIAALGTPDEAKSERLVSALADMPMESFIDGDGDARDFSRAILDKAGMVKLLWKATQVLDNLKEDLGLNPGDKFLQWLTEALGAVGIRTYADLVQKLHATPHGLHRRDGEELLESQRCGRLAMIAADVTTETKVELPKMAHLYWADPASMNPACFARASMSIPLFFKPFQVCDCPQAQALRADWEKLAGYLGELPKEVFFVDGGIMSNFPINLFHQPHRVPSAPTFGAKIGIDRSKPVAITKPAQLVGCIFDAARHTLDYDFILKNPDYRHLVKMIDTGDHNWLNFSMSNDDKLDLFAIGAAAAAEFLGGFDWENYKSIRRDLAEAFKKSTS